MTVYLLLGDDEERKARGVEKLRRGRSAESFDAAGTSPETVVSACNSFSLFGEGPFVVVRNLDAWNAAQKAVVVTYLEDPSPEADLVDRKSTRLNSSHANISYAVFCLKKKTALDAFRR